MRKDWEMKMLGDLANIMYGHTSKSSSKFNGPKYLRITDIKEGDVNWQGVPSCHPIGDDYSKYKLKYGDIVFARTGATTGKSFFIEDPPKAVFASYLIRVQSETEDLLPEYLYKYFQSPEYWNVIKKGTTGSAQGGFNATKLGNLSIPLPPLEEQKRIVSILDEAFEAIGPAEANIEQNIANAEELFESKLNEVFYNSQSNWVKNRLADSFRMRSGDYLPKKNTVKGIYPVYGGNGITGTHEEYNLTGEQILVGRVGAQCGNVHLTSERLWLTDNAFRLTDFEYEFDFNFLKYLLEHKDLRRTARHTAQPVISNSSCKEIILTFPESLKAQRKIASHLMRLEQKKEMIIRSYQKKIEKVTDLKKSILQQAFSGALTGPESGFAGLSDEQDRAVHKAAEPEQAYEVE